MKVISIEGTKRDELGSKSAKLLRREGNVPCVIYGGEENIHFSTPEASFKEVLYSTEAHILEIKLGDESVKSVLRDVQYHPLTDAVEHVDLLQLVPGKAVTLDVPVKLIGNAIGVRNGGKLKVNFRKLKVKGTEENLPGTIDINIENLRIGQTIRVGEITPEGYEILNEDFLAVLNIKTTRNAVADEEEEGEEAPTEEGAAAEA
jgi:large subunit ribosomal protein L25